MSGKDDKQIDEATWTPLHDVTGDKRLAELLTLAEKLGCAAPLRTKLRNRGFGQYAAARRAALDHAASVLTDEFEFTADNKLTLANIIAYAKATGMSLSIRLD